MRSGNDDFVSRVDEGEEGIGDAMLGAVGDHHARGGVVEAVLPRELARDGLAEIGVSRDGSVEIVPFVYGPLGRLAHGLGSGEVGLADGEVDDIDSGLAESAGPLVHGDGAGRRETANASGELLHGRDLQLDRPRRGRYHGEPHIYRLKTRIDAIWGAMPPSAPVRPVNGARSA